MAPLLQSGPELAAMLVILVFSAFFSGSEAAFFCLDREDRRVMQLGGPAQRMADELLKQPQRLLTAVLFCNLIFNFAYFALTSMITLRMEREGFAAESGMVAVGALVTIIIFGEMLPKNAAVLHPQLISRLASLPMALVVRLVDPLLPVFRFVRLISQRLAIPNFRPETYLELGDLERAIDLSTKDEAIARQESAVGGILQQVVRLSDVRVEEVMRPRLQYESHRVPVHLADLEGKAAPGGYVLVTEHDSDEVIGAIRLDGLPDVPARHLEHYAEGVIYVPWCTTVATTLDELRKQRRSVAAVINEHGETIGIVTIDDVLESVVQYHSSRSERILDAASIVRVGDGVWDVTGMTTLRRLARHLELELPTSKSVTITGILQEQLQRLPHAGDAIEWGGLRIRVLRAPARGVLRARVERLVAEESAGGGT